MTLADGLSLPAPALENPFKSYLVALELAFQSTAPEAFKTRVLALYVMCGLALLSAMVYMTLMWIDSRKRKIRMVWLFRLVGRPSGRYLVVNTKLASAVLSIVNVTLILCYFWDLSNGLYSNGDQRLSALWRTAFLIPLSLHALSISFGQLSAYLITQGHTLGDGENRRGPIVSARVANSFFVGVTLAIVIALLIGTVCVGVTSTKLWDLYLVVDAALQALVTAYDNGTTNFSDLAQLVPLKDRLGVLAAQQTQEMLALHSIVTVTCFIVIVINVGSILLTRVVRRQARRRFATYPHTVHLDFNLSVSPVSSKAEDLSPSEQPEVEKEKWSRQSMQRIAGRADRGLEGQKALAVLEILKAERDLIVTASVIGGLGVLTLVMSLWLEIAVVAGPGWFTGGWASREAALTIIPWLYLFCVTAINSFLIYKVLVKTPDPSAAPPKPSTPLLLPRRFTSQPNSPNPGGAPSGRVRVAIEEVVREEVRLEQHGVGDDWRETTIEGGREYDGLPSLVEFDRLGGGLSHDVGWSKPAWAVGDEEAQDGRLTVPAIARTRMDEGRRLSGGVGMLPTISSVVEEGIPLRSHHSSTPSRRPF